MQVWNSQLRQLWRRPKVVSQLSVAPLPLSLELSQMTKLNNFWVEFGFKFALKLELKSISIFTNSNRTLQNWVGLFKVHSFDDQEQTGWKMGSFSSLLGLKKSCKNQKPGFHPRQIGQFSWERGANLIFYSLAYFSLQKFIFWQLFSNQSQATWGSLVSSILLCWQRLMKRNKKTCCISFTYL